MLYNSFIQIPGIGARSEQLLWQSGIRSWDDVRLPLPEVVPAGRSRLIVEHIERQRLLKDAPPLALARLFPTAERWRLFPHYRDRTAYLDIETNGAGRESMAITAVSLYDGHAVHSYVQGENLAGVIDHLNEFEVLVTYNGRSFDVPVLERAFGIRLRQVQLDLRHILHRLGLKGGLKGCEKRLGLDRGGLDGLDGYAAVLLWQEFARSGDRRFLETLLAYNIEDTVNLETLMVHAYNRNLAETPFAESHRLPLPRQPRRPYLPHPEIVRRIKAISGTGRWGGARD